MRKQKIVEIKELVEICKEKRNEGKRIVHCHGCFDLLHPGHIRHFKAAKEFGDILVVTITPDKFVRKGSERPIFNAQLRIETIAALEVVDYVSLNKWDTAVRTIKSLKPDFYVKGNDYSNRSKDVTGNILLEEEAVKKGGGEIKFTNEISFSSTRIINEHYSILSDEAKDYINLA